MQPLSVHGNECARRRISSSSARGTYELIQQANRDGGQADNYDRDHFLFIARLRRKTGAAPDVPRPPWESGRGSRPAGRFRRHVIATGAQ
jgi:hypothetical protein